VGIPSNLINRTDWKNSANPKNLLVEKEKKEDKGDFQLGELKGEAKK